MKLKSTFLFFTSIVIVVLITGNTARAQQYKLRQVNSMMGMKSESTIYVKGMRKRTEADAMMGMGTNLITIEQCDLQRTIRINNKKKLYYIDPFSKEAEEIIDEDMKPAVKAKPVTAVSSKTTTKQTGGVINMWYNIIDTGERKKMYGFTARHVWTTQKIKPSPDACMMKDSMIIKTDGWYIDLPQFNCPVSYGGQTTSRTYQQPDCKDRFVTRRSGKGKLGFPLIETRTMIMGNGSAQTNQFETSIETLEFSTTKLDSMLFEIPPGYKQALSADELQDKFDVSEIMNQAGKINRENGVEKTNPNQQKKAGVIRIGVYEPKSNEQLQVSKLQQHLVNTLTGGSIEAVAIASADDAKEYNCDLLLTTDFVSVKQASKIGGLLKAIKNTDPSAASSYNIEANLVLLNASDGSTFLQQKVNGKYEGQPDDAAKKALDNVCFSAMFRCFVFL